MRNCLRVMATVGAAALAIAVAAPSANAVPADEILVAHRGATTKTVAEGTLPSYKYAVKSGADILDGDVRWTKDGSDADHVGTMIIAHDSTLNRVTNCSGAVSKKLWTYIRDHCRTSKATGSQRLIKLSELLAFAGNRTVALQIKLTSLSTGQARQFWAAVRNSKVILEASSGQIPAMNKIAAMMIPPAIAAANIDRKPQGRSKSFASRLMRSSVFTGDYSDRKRPALSARDEA